MTPEEKAKAYDKLFAKAKQIYNKENDVLIMHTIETLFPELKESEDEKIRKWIINEIKIKHHNLDEENVDFADKAIAWLEKQGTSYTKRDVNDAYLKGVTDTKNEIEKQYEANYQIRKDIATFIFNYRGDIKDRAKWINYLGIKVSFVEKQDEQPRYSIGDVLCDKSCTTLDKESQPNFEIIDIKDGMYICDKGSFPISQQDEYELVAKRIEQKPTDKVEPKFKVGDWLINPRTSHIIHIKDVLICGNKGIYELENSSMSIENIEYNFRLWTIQDAKDGDVLVTRKKQPFIFKNYDEDTDYIYAYCGICDLVKDNSFYADDDQLWTCYSVAGDVYPATKEQCDLLFRKMKEAGYEWDANTKELKKINSYCQENCKGFQETGKCFADEECKAKREAEQELTDLEEFVNELSKQFPDVSFAKLSRIVVRVAKWAKSNQPKQEWNDVDKDILSRIIDDLKFLRDTVSIDPKYSVSIIDMEREITWLKYLRPQNKWKPSNKQISQLQSVIDTYGSKGIYDPILTELLFQLKKLKEDKYG